MATITGTIQGQEADDIGEGTIFVGEVSSTQNIFFLRNSNEEILSLGSPTYTVVETAGSVSVTFLRNRPRHSTPLSFNVVTEPGTGVAGVNYQPLASPQSFLADQNTITRSVVILNASMPDGVTKTFNLRITPANSFNVYTRGPGSLATVTIT